MDKRREGKEAAGGEAGEREGAEGKTGGKAGERIRDEKYEDIINLPHHQSLVHPQMSSYARAAQFSPFAALTGYDAAVKETARLTENRVELSEYEKAKLDMRLKILRGHPESAGEVTFTYFVPDERKKGGSYYTVTGRIKKIDDYKRRILLEDGTEIPICEIIELDGRLFSAAENEII